MPENAGLTRDQARLPTKNPSPRVRSESMFCEISAEKRRVAGVQ